MRRLKISGGLALAVCASGLIAAPVAGATTYRNDTPITINEGGSATPYPSSITVSGTAGPITDVNVGIDGFTHFFPDDVSIALVAPSGQALALHSCVGDTTDAAGLAFTYDDAAATHLPDSGALATGTYKPTSHCNPAPSFPPPGPTSSYGNPGPALGGTATFASTFNGLSPIGTWNLYVFDRNPSLGGSISGWSLDVKPDVTPPPPPPPPPPVEPSAPETTLTATPKAKAKSKMSRFEFSSDRSGATFECSLDGGGFQACISPKILRVKRGKHNFQVRALAGGTADATPASYSWKVKKKRKKK